MCLDPRVLAYVISVGLRANCMAYYHLRKHIVIDNLYVLLIVLSFILLLHMIFAVPTPMC